MGGITPEPQLTNQQSDSNWRPVLLGVGLVVVVIGLIAFFLRGTPAPTKSPDPYAAKLTLSDLKMSAAENFVGASVTYLDGTVTNTGDKTVTHAIVHLQFNNSLGQVAQIEDVPLRILQTSGPYPDAVDLSVSPLRPGQSEPFRLTLEHISADWDRQYPSMQITEVARK